MEPKRFFDPAIFKGIGEPTLTSSADLRAIQANCLKRKNKNCFYLAIDVRLPVSISWQHNTDLHFNQAALSFSEYYQLIHPYWQSIYRALTISGYEITRKMNEDGLTKSRAYSGYIPMRQTDGSYAWYKQFVIHGSYDEKDNPVHHHHEYQRLGPFDRLCPTPAEITTAGIVDTGPTKELVLAGGVAMNKVLKTVLTPSSYRNLQAFRENTRFIDGAWVTPSSAAMQGVLSLNQQALNKANTRILRAARVAFPKCTLDSVGSFSVFLNELFGCPAQDESQ